MKNGMLAIGVVALTAMATTNAFAQKKPAKCTNVPLTVEILAIGPDNTGALDGDAKGRIYTGGSIKDPSDNSDYVSRFKADVTDAPIPRQTASEPGTVPVTVQEDTLVASATGSKHSWTVTTLPGPSIGALYKTSTDAPAGTYDMPFRLRFATKGCVTLPW